MRVCIISTTILPCPPSGYSGLEMVAFQQAAGLARRGHSVMLVAPGGPNGSKPPEGVELHGTTLGESEQQAYSGYWPKLPNFDAIIDNSVSGKDELLVRIDDKCKWLSLEDLFSICAARGPAIIDGATEIPTHGIEVLSMSLDGISIEWRPVSAAIRHTNAQPLCEVRTQRGLVCHVTGRHALFAAGADGIEIVGADNISGRIVATLKRCERAAKQKDIQYLPFDLRSLDLLVFGNEVRSVVKRYRDRIIAQREGIKPASAKQITDIWIRRGMARICHLPELPSSCIIKGMADSAGIKWPIALTDELLTLFGLWIGDGCYDKCSVKISCGETGFDAVRKAARQLGLEAKLGSVRPDVNILINSVVLKKVMMASGFVGHVSTKRIPDWVFDCSAVQIGAFLRGLFSSDGCIRRSGNTVVVSMCNRRVLEQARLLLSMLGMHPTICSMPSSTKKSGFHSTRMMHELSVSRSYFDKFASLVGFADGERNAFLKTRIVERPSWSPDVPNFMVGKDYKRVDIQARPENRRAAATCGIEIDTAWLKVKSVSVLDEKPEYVYDLSVPGTENFVVNGIVCHNSWQKWSYILKAEGKLKAPVLGVLHAPPNTMYATPPPVPLPCIVAISKDQAFFVSECWGVPARVAYNGMDPDFYKPIPGIQKNGRYLFLARFSKIKGPHIAVDIARKLRFGLDLVGDDTLTNEPDYVQRIRALAQNNIKYWGPVPREKCVEFFTASKALLHMNMHYREPFGMAPVEAAMTGLPCISFDNGAMRETIKHGETGFLVKKEEEVEELIKTDAVSTIKPEACREWASQFSVKNMVLRYEELCKEAIDKGW